MIMQAEKSLRINILELKAQMLKKIGSERFRRYFFCLNRFINQKLSKSEFDKSCHRFLGRENLPLHNQIIRAILKNAYTANTPPPVHEIAPTRALENGHGQSSVNPVWSNGDGLPMSPRKNRSSVRDRKLRDRGPNGKVDFASQQSIAAAGTSTKTVENGELMPFDYQRPVQELRGLAEPPENEGVMIKKAVDFSNYASVVEDGEEVEQGSHLKFSRGSLLAPLGIPLCSASLGGGRKPLSITRTSDFLSCFDTGELSDSDVLRKRMDQMALATGLGGVTMECANMLNNTLDLYLKRLIKSCIELAGAKSTNHSTKPKTHPKIINGLYPNNHLHSQSRGTIEEQRDHCHSISLLDFKVAMEINPRQLGEDWPLLLEKISMQAFET